MSEPEPDADPADVTAVAARAVLDTPPVPDTPPVLDTAAALDLLRNGELELQGRLVDASNATLLVGVTGPFHGAEVCVQAVYTPVRGERPLWDFPEGTLAGREVGSYLVSEATGWGVIPPTVLRDGPYGPGMVQLWIDIDEEVDVVALVRSKASTALRRVAVLDAVINNADRKGGHLLPVDGAAHIFGIDHGVAFSCEDKLRTLLWQWRGDALTEDERAVLGHLRQALTGGLGATLSRLVQDVEVAVALDRVERLLADGTMPFPSGDWPATPWPPF